MRVAITFLVFCSFVLASSSQAGHHSWAIEEVFSDAGGTIQFVEIFSAGANEGGLDTWTIVSTSTGKIFTFDSNVVNPTGGKRVLVGTTTFAGLANAPAPDYVLPDAFFDTAGDTLTYANGADSWAFGAVPTNGTDSLDRITGVGPNTPENFDGDTGTVDANPPAGTPGLGAWGLVLLAGLMMVAASGLMKRKSNTVAV